MGWVKLDDAFFTDQRAVRAGPDGRALYLAGLCFCARNETDGRIDSEALPVIAALAGVPQDVAARLITIGLWTQRDDCWVVPNYLRYNPSREQLEAKRAADAERQRRSRSESRRDSEATGDVSPSVPSRPVPDGVLSSSSSVTGTGDDGCPQVPEEVWVEYARLKRAQSKEPVRNPSQWDAKVIRNAKAEQGAQAAKWLEVYDVTPRELASGLVEGNVGRYWTRRAVSV